MYSEKKQALAAELSLKRPAVLAVSGAHNSGKTTLLEKLIPLLRARGLKVGVIKHDGHDFTPDVPGTDSFRLREAGAEGVAVFSGSRYLLTEEFRLNEQDLLALFERHGYDLVLMEGFKESGWPKIEVVRKAVSEEPVSFEPLAIVGDVPGAEFALDEPAALADGIAAQMPALYQGEEETMKLIRTEDAAGQVLCHDITQIIPGEFKGARFKKGHIIQPEDIPVLLSIGKENLYVWEKKPGILHEDEAAALLYKAAAGQNIHGTEPREGKIELIADCDGLLKIDRRALLAVNSTPQMMIATIHGDLPVKKGAKLAGTRIIPLVIEQEKMEAMQAAAGPKPILNVLPFHQKKFAVITTGSEVFKGRIEDKFTPILEQKLAVYGCEMAFHKVCDDDPAGITAAILEAKAAGCELIFTTGGMSVDPDDRTPLAIRNTGAEIITYGAPVLPGAMFLVSYLDGVPVCGLPGCVMYAKRTIFDLLLPRLLADDPITAEDIARLGEGGLCLGCAECHWPNCGFGHC